MGTALPTVYPQMSQGRLKVTSGETQMSPFCACRKGEDPERLKTVQAYVKKIDTHLEMLLEVVDVLQDRLVEENVFVFA